jgi:hypothetical protein
MLSQKGSPENRIPEWVHFRQRGFAMSGYAPEARQRFDPNFWFLLKGAPYRAFIWRGRTSSYIPKVCRCSSILEHDGPHRFVGDRHRDARVDEAPRHTSCNSVDL